MQQKALAGRGAAQGTTMTTVIGACTPGWSKETSSVETPLSFMCTATDLPCLAQVRVTLALASDADAALQQDQFTQPVCCCRFAVMTFREHHANATCAVRGYTRAPCLVHLHVKRPPGIVAADQPQVLARCTCAQCKYRTKYMLFTLLNKRGHCTDIQHQSTSSASGLARKARRLPCPLALPSC